MLRTALHLGHQIDRCQSLPQRGHHLFQLAFSLFALLGDAVNQSVICLGLQVAQGDVFHLPLNAPHAEAMRQRRVNLQCLSCNLLLTVDGQVPEGTHVVEAVGKLYEDHPHILGHGEKHLTQGLSLLLLFRAEMDLRQLRDAVDEQYDLGPELRSSSSRVTWVSSRTSWSRPAAIVTGSSPSSAKILATPRGCWKKASPSRGTARWAFSANRYARSMQSTSARAIASNTFDKFADSHGLPSPEPYMR